MSLPGDPAPGALYLVPNALDFGMPEPLPALTDALPLGAIHRAARLRHWVAENAKTTRAFLKRVAAIEPLVAPLQELSIVELPRPRKGTGATLTPSDVAPLLEPTSHGHDIGLISEAGLPAVADPGAALVRAAHGAGLRVVSLAGPSSILLALAASGLNGQSFTFVGYLAAEPTARAVRIRELEALSRRSGQTQLMIETPYRNAALLDALLTHLSPTTELSLSWGLTLPSATTRTDRIAAWRAHPTRLPADVPAIFALLGN